jgi:hypothetical protein
MKRQSFAAGTTVPVDKTRLEIERLLRAHGAGAIASGSSPHGVVLCDMRGRRLRFTIPIVSAPAHDARGKARVEKGVQRLWRCLLLIIKAKLEAVSSRMSTFDSEFLANIVVPGEGGKTVDEWIKPALALAYERGGGALPALMLEPHH